MKKIFVFTVLLFFASQSFACPICGCGVGNFYMGLLPNFKSKFIGIRYQSLPYHTQIAGDEGEFSHDYYHTAELWGGISVGSKWQLLAFVPYQINKQKTDDGDKNLNGLGDISLLANYKVFDKMQMKGSGSSVQQQLWIGGGVKLPTGKSHIDLNDPEIELGDVNAQAGSGSVDFLVNTSYNIRMNKFGINTTVNYKINTNNSEHYTFGNRLNASSFGYYQLTLNKVRVAPNIGVLYQHSEINHLNNQKVDETGGYLAMAAAGAEISIRNITLGGNVQLPVAQNFAHGQTEAKTRTMLHVSFTF